MKRYKVPANFWDDHCDRCPCDGNPEQAMANEVSRAGRRVLIEGTDAQIEVLRSDAEFYAEGNVDDCESLVRSAQATVRALAPKADEDIAKAVAAVIADGDNWEEVIEKVPKK